MTTRTGLNLTRRGFMAGSGGVVLISALPLASHASEADLIAARTKLFGNRPTTEGRVSVKLPPIAENGYSVPLEVSVDSPMTDADYVKRIAILSPRNPLPQIAEFHMTPLSSHSDQY